MSRLEQALGLTLQEFQKEYWRKKPLVVKGGASAFGRLDQNLFSRLYAGMKVSRPQDITEGPGVRFLQRVDAVSEAHTALSREIKKSLGCPRAHFDVVECGAGKSIGCHFDHSDNFVLQQTGVKLWMLHNPSIIPLEQIRGRVSGQANGRFLMPEAEYTFELQPGDLMYIPLFWIHWGKSLGRSLSQSLVIDAESKAGKKGAPKINWSDSGIDWASLVKAVKNSPAGSLAPANLKRFLQISRPLFEALAGTPWQMQWLELLRRIFLQSDVQRILEDRRVYDLHAEAAQALSDDSYSAYQAVIYKYQNAVVG